MKSNNVYYKVISIVITLAFIFTSNIYALPYKDTLRPPSQFNSSMAERFDKSGKPLSGSLESLILALELLEEEEFTYDDIEIIRLRLTDSGNSERTIRREIKDAITYGLIEDTGKKDGKTIIYRRLVNLGDEGFQNLHHGIRYFLGRGSTFVNKEKNIRKLGGLKDIKDEINRVATAIDTYGMQGVRYRRYASILKIPALGVLGEAGSTHYELAHQTPGVELDTHQATLDYLEGFLTATEETKVEVYITGEASIKVRREFIPTLASIAALRMGSLHGQPALFLLKPAEVFHNAVHFPLLGTVARMRKLDEPITKEQVIQLMSPHAIYDMKVALTISQGLIDNYRAEVGRASGERQKELEETLRVLEGLVGVEFYLDAFRVQDDVTLGAGKGGIRYASRGDLDLVRTLAGLMTWKDTILAYGGAKGEVSFIITLADGTVSIDPGLLPPADRAAVSRSFARGAQGTKGLAYIIGSLRDVPAGDMNTDGAVMAWIADEILKICVEEGWNDIDGIPVPLEVLKEEVEKAQTDPDQTKTHYLAALMDGFRQGRVPSLALIAMITGKPFREEGKEHLSLKQAYGGGHAFRSDATGASQVQATAHAIEKGAVEELKTLRDATAAIQGFGNVGMSAAHEAYKEYGVQIRGLSDKSGSFWVDEDSLPIEDIVAWFEAYKARKNRYPTLSEWYEAEGEALGVNHDYEDSKIVLYMDVDVIFPDALQRQITAENAHRIKALVVSEGANAPTIPEADRILQAKGIVVLPDFIFNAGGVAGSYIEWIENMTMTLAELEALEEGEMYQKGKEQVVGILNKAFDEVMAYCREKAIPFTEFRSVARILAIKRLLEPEDPATRPELQGEVLVVDEQGKQHYVPLHVLVSRKGDQLAAYLLADSIMAEALVATGKTNGMDAGEIITLLRSSDGGIHAALRYEIAQQVAIILATVSGVTNAWLIGDLAQDLEVDARGDIDFIIQVYEEQNRAVVHELLASLNGPLTEMFNTLMEETGVSLPSGGILDVAGGRIVTFDEMQDPHSVAATLIASIDRPPLRLAMGDSDGAVATSMVEKRVVEASSSDDQAIQEAMSKIIVWAAQSVVSKGKIGFATWLAIKLDANKTVIIIARNPAEYRQVEYLKDDERVHIKVVYGEGQGVDEDGVMIDGEGERVDALGLEPYQILRKASIFELNRMFSELEIFYVGNGLDLQSLSKIVDEQKGVIEDIYEGV
ncbi:MAG: hypothetical protein KJ957_02335 [Candidatus Omnitrophica bacterium]|nr:hypothetical protein [Candidatus Omnitrophota bacterium]